MRARAPALPFSCAGARRSGEAEDDHGRLAVRRRRARGGGPAHRPARTGSADPARGCGHHPGADARPHHRPVHRDPHHEAGAQGRQTRPVAPAGVRRRSARLPGRSADGPGAVEDSGVRPARIGADGALHLCGRPDPVQAVLDARDAALRDGRRMPEVPGHRSVHLVRRYGEAAYRRGAGPGSGVLRARQVCPVPQARYCLPRLRGKGIQGVHDVPGHGCREVPALRRGGVVPARRMRRHGHGRPVHRGHGRLHHPPRLTEPSRAASAPARPAHDRTRRRLQPAALARVRAGPVSGSGRPAPPLAPPDAQRGPCEAARPRPQIARPVPRCHSRADV